MDTYGEAYRQCLEPYTVALTSQDWNRLIDNQQDSLLSVYKSSISLAQYLVFY